MFVHGVSLGPLLSISNEIVIRPLLVDAMVTLERVGLRSELLDTTLVSIDSSSVPVLWIRVEYDVAIGCMLVATDALEEGGPPMHQK